MQSWFYIKDGQQHGPISEDTIIQMFTAGTLSLDTLVWTKELKEWTTARDVEGLISKDLLPPPIIPPPPIRNETLTTPIVVNQYQPSGSQILPWTRYWARMADFFLFCFLSGIILVIVYEPALKMNDLLLGIILTFVYIFVEPIMLSSWGTTPGKALLRVRIRRQDGKKVTYSEGLNRAFQVWLKGLGAGIPVIALFTQINAYRCLIREGKTSWDRDGHFVISHQTVGPLRIVITVLLFVGFFVIVALGKMEN